MSKNQSAVLIAEDNAEIAKLIKLYLEGEGYKTVWAEDGAVGLAAARNEAFSAVLVDIMMPKMNGYKATQAIRCLPDKDKACIPIIAMTANAFEEDKRDALAVGMNGHIAKPIELDKLLSMLAEVIRQQENC